MKPISLDFTPHDHGDTGVDPVVPASSTEDGGHNAVGPVPEPGSLDFTSPGVYWAGSVASVAGRFLAALVTVTLRV